MAIFAPMQRWALLFLLTGCTWTLAPRAAVAGDAIARSAQQFAVWTSTGAHVQVGERWWVTGETQVRRFNGLAQPMQAGILLAPEYRTGSWSLQVGYAFWNTSPYGAFRTDAAQREHRGWTQAGFQHPLGKLAMDHRLRVEHRALERYRIVGEVPVSQGFHYVGRLRYRTRLVVPLNTRQRTAGEWQAIVQKEWMLRYGDERFVGAFDQLRPAVLLGYRPLDHLQLTAGYQMHHLVRANGLDREFNHTLMVGAHWRWPMRTRIRPSAEIASLPPVGGGR
jgi:hypothetical protein